jgi:hypothetical protein
LIIALALVLKSTITLATARAIEGTRFFGTVTLAPWRRAL